MTEEICDNIPHKEHPEIVKFITERMSFFESLGKLSQKNDETGHTPEKLAEAIVKSNNIPEDKLKAAIADEVKRIKKMDQNGDRIVSMPEFLNSECKDHQESLGTPQVPMIKESPINGVMIRRM